MRIDNQKWQVLTERDLIYFVKEQNRKTREERVSTSSLVAEKLGEVFELSLITTFSNFKIRRLGLAVDRRWVVKIIIIMPVMIIVVVKIKAG